MSSRKSELEAKRQRLEELRKQRERRTQQLLPERSDSTSPLFTTTSSGDIHTYVDNLLGESSSTRSFTQSSNSSKDHKSISTQTEPTQPPEAKKAEVITYNKGIQTDSIEIQEQELAAENLNLQLEDESIQETQDAHEIDGTVSINDEQLSKFLTHSFKIINRAIQEDNDILREYSNEYQKTSKSTRNDIPQLYQKIDEIGLSKDLISDDSNHGVYSIGLSRFTNDLMAISIGYRVLIYNLHFRKLELQFYSTSQITNIRFSLTQPDLIIGTCFNGKIKVWNMNEESVHYHLSAPILESQVSPKTHSYPVSSITQFIDHNEEHLITSSTDGRICHWNAQILNRTISDPISIKMPKHSNVISLYDEINPTSTFRLCTSHQNSILIGSEDGNIYQIPNISAIVKASDDSVKINSVWQSHKAPVTAVIHSSDPELSNLVVSSSMDWKCQLWNITTQSPFQEIYRNFSILDIQFRPQNPLQLGLIYNDTFEIVNIFTNSVMLSITTKGTMLNKLSFINEKKVAIGDINGTVTIYEILSGRNDDRDLEKFKRKHGL